MRKNQLKSFNGITLIALVITIIVLLILAGVSIATLTGDNGILTQANKAKNENIKAQEKEQISLAMQSLKMDKILKNLSSKITPEELQNQLLVDGAKKVTVSNAENNNLLVSYQNSKNTYLVNQEGNILDNDKSEESENTTKLWEITNISDSEWFSYNDLSNKNSKSKVNSPKLIGNMKPIKYIGPESDTQTGSKWANAVTTDGSMWVWLPRYAYKITTGYHTNQAGTIEVAFIDNNNNFLNGESGELTVNPKEEGAGTTKWLVHPAFTASAENGGGFGELTGLWIGKFETTGTYSNGDASKITVKPGIPSLRSTVINDHYTAGKNARYGESVDLKSHMAKNSEWGATSYLAHSKYGTNKQKIEQNLSSSFFTGGSNNISEIYTTNKKQSTTHNATGIYDLNGGAHERIAGYVNTGHKNLSLFGGTSKGDLYGATPEEQQTNTAYKTIYLSENHQEKDYQASQKYKGDAIYETSSASSYQQGAWFNAFSNFPFSNAPFFDRSCNYENSYSGSFFFGAADGNQHPSGAFRLVLAL